MFLRWKPDNLEDTQAEIPDFSLGNFSLHVPHIKLQLGIKVKWCINAMEALPDSLAFQSNVDIMSAFHKIFFQGKDQAKATVKGTIFRRQVQHPGCYS